MLHLNDSISAALVTNFPPVSFLATCAHVYPPVSLSPCLCVYVSVHLFASYQPPCTCLFACYSLTLPLTLPIYRSVFSPPYLLSSPPYRLAAYFFLRLSILPTLLPACLFVCLPFLLLSYFPFLAARP